MKAHSSTLYYILNRSFQAVIYNYINAIPVPAIFQSQNMYCCSVNLAQCDA